MYQRGGILAITSSNMTRNHATRDGGYVALYGGFITVSASFIQNNSALRNGANSYAQGGTIAYALPAPPGYWVPAQECQVYREACTESEAGYLACLADYDECSQIATSSATAASGTVCKDITFSQPCDWSSLPHLVGSYIYPLPSGSYDEDLPFACGSGLVGGLDNSTQANSFCAGRCPAGFVCASEPTLVPVPCESRRVELAMRSLRCALSAACVMLENAADRRSRLACLKRQVRPPATVRREVPSRCLAPLDTFGH